MQQVAMVQVLIELPCVGSTQVWATANEKPTSVEPQQVTWLDGPTTNVQVFSVRANATEHSHRSAHSAGP